MRQISTKTKSNALYLIPFFLQQLSDNRCLWFSISLFLIETSLTETFCKLFDVNTMLCHKNDVKRINVKLLFSYLEWSLESSRMFRLLLKWIQYSSNSCEQRLFNGLFFDKIIHWNCVHPFTMWMNVLS